MCDPVDLGIDDFVEAQEITDEWQVIAVAHPSNAIAKDLDQSQQSRLTRSLMWRAAGGFSPRPTECSSS